MLIKSLNELDELVGMKVLKTDIVRQVKALIMDKKRGKDKASDYSLNTLLCGTPGVGKTVVGVILAKIWYALGFLNPGVKVSGGGGIEGIVESTLIIALGVKLIEILRSLSPWLFYGGIILMFLIILSIWVSKNKVEQRRIARMQSGDVENSDIVSVVSRKDFVAEYMGQTDQKTMKLIEANKGKVLFVDEAYSLYGGYNDPYGQQALTTLNQYMTEHPKDVIVIFAGYEDKMKQGIFKAQEGLVSRFSWRFECAGYSADELVEMFFKKLEKEEWIIEDKDSIAKLIKENHKLFKAYGRDIGRLINYSKASAMEKSFEDTYVIREYDFINIDDVTKAINTFKGNNIGDMDESKSKTSPEEVLRRLIDKTE
jgi:DNA polymerase III delta prime subunit